MIRKILFAILLAHSALIAQGKPSRIILQAAPPNPNPQVPAQAPPQIPPVELPQLTPQVPGQTIPPPQVPTEIQPQTPITTVSSSTAINAPGTGTGTTVKATTAPPAPATTVGSSTVTNAPQTVTSAPGTVTNAPNAGTTAAATTVAPNTVTTAPITPAPVTPMATIPAPVTPAPTTPAPTTPAPTTPAPTTPAPTTPAPTTPAPTTVAPALAPLPAGYEYGSWGQVCPITAHEQDCVINGQMIQSEAINNRGIINCDRTADCCKCGSIQCGVVSQIAGLPRVEPHGCLQFSAGDFGAYGVKQVVVIGNPASAQGGAQISCVGRSGCQDINLFGDTITDLMCNVDNSCSHSIIQIDNPVDANFWIDCNGIESCKDTKITVNIGTPIPEGQMCNPNYVNVRRFGGIKCNAASSCDGLELNINNRGCDKVIFEHLDLLQVTGASFNFNGNIDIDNCVCGPTCGFASGLGKCFQNLERLICPDPRSCMNMEKTIINPMDMFYLECSGELSCAMSKLTIELEQGQDPLSPNFIFKEPVRYIQSLKFGGVNSGRGGVIYINNNQLMDIVTIGLLECSAINSCQGLTIYTGDNVNIMHRICGSFEACLGCMIKRDEFDIGIPCNPEPMPFVQPQWPAIPQQPPQFVPGPPVV